MSQPVYELLYCFFLYSFAGWALEVCYYSWRKKKFVNPGFLNGPFCPIYGAALVWMIAAFPELKGRYFFEFLAFAIVASFLQYITGHVLEKLFHRRWWDYSGHPHNIDGFVSLRMAVLWGAGSLIILKFAHPFAVMLIRLIPFFIGRLLLLALFLLLTLDTVGTVVAIHYWNRNIGRISEINEGLQSLSRKIGLWLFSRVRKRLERAEAAKPAEQVIADVCGEELGVFARGCCFYKLVWLFFIGAFLGDITETIFCHATTGIWMSRSSVVYGPFSIVWGMGVVLLTATLSRFYDREDRYIFLAGTFLGGVYEYLCSVFTERVFGTVFWDYSKIPFNLGGRINLLYCFFWGIAALIWLKLFYPRFSAWIEKIPIKPGKIISWLLIVFMAANVVISSLALIRYAERNTSAKIAVTAAENPDVEDLTRWLDERFDDERMERIYPNIILKTGMAGLQFNIESEDEQADLNAIAPGTELLLYREPENEYDQWAIAVHLTDKDRLGYISRYKNEPIARLMDAGKKFIGVADEPEADAMTDENVKQEPQRGHHAPTENMAFPFSVYLIEEV